MINNIGEKKVLVDKLYQIVLIVQYLMPMMILDLNKMDKFNQQLLCLFQLVLIDNGLKIDKRVRK